jgi:Pectate lyase superfamily protein/Right handed beta helix region
MTIDRRLFLLLSSSLTLSVIIGNDRSATSKTCKIINVKKYGAVGDGIADDTTVIQKAIDLGCSLYFPAGTYKVNGLNLRSNCTYYGDGESSVIKLFQKTYSREEVSSSQSNISFNLNGLQNVKINNLRFICPTSKSKNSPATEYTNIAINIDSSKNCQIKSLTIEQFSGVAILCAGTSLSKRCTNILVDKVRIKNWYDTYEGSFPQIWFFKYVYDSTVQNSSLVGGTFGIGFYDAYFGTKIDAKSADLPGSGVYRCSAVNNVIKNQTRYGILLYCTKSVAFPKELVQHKVRGNTVSNILGSSHSKERSFGAGIYAVGVTGLTISNNNVSNCNQRTNDASLAPGCIGIVGCFGEILIDSNTCSDGKWSNLYINNVNPNGSGKLTVTNNTLKNSVKENLFIANCNNAVFSRNNVSSGAAATLAVVSLRSVKNTTFDNNKIFFNSSINHDGIFIFQSSNLKVINNSITTSNPVSVNRVQEVSESTFSGNVYTSANSSDDEPVRFVNCRNNQFTKNTIKKRSGGRQVRHYP